MKTTPFAKALAYLDALEADRQAALVLSEQKAKEAKLIKARQEGFQEAMDMLGTEITVSDTGSDPDELHQRRVRRKIPELILRELSFSGRAMATAEVARAINYVPERTETALRRMEKSGKVLRGEKGRWEIDIGTTVRIKRESMAGADAIRNSAKARKPDDCSPSLTHYQ